MRPEDSTAGSFPDVRGKEAAEWFVIIHSEDEPNPDTLQAWLRWLEQDDGNRIAFESVARAWHGTPEAVVLSMPSAEEVAADSFEGDMPVSDWPVRPSVRSE